MFDDKSIGKPVDREEEMDYMSSCAQTDCTGLIPALPLNSDEVESYEELYRFVQPAVKSAKNSEEVFVDKRKQTKK